jgi:hypothetical protein
MNYFINNVYNGIWNLKFSTSDDDAATTGVVDVVQLAINYSVDCMFIGTNRKLDLYPSTTTTGTIYR